MSRDDIEDVVVDLKYELISDTERIVRECAESPRWESRVSVMAVSVELAELIRENRALKQGLIENCMDESVVEAMEKIYVMMKERGEKLEGVIAMVVELNEEYESENFWTFDGLKRQMCGEEEA
jgi:hypothetical protein